MTRSVVFKNNYFFCFFPSLLVLVLLPVQGQKSDTVRWFLRRYTPANSSAFAAPMPPVIITSVITTNSVITTTYSTSNNMPANSSAFAAPMPPV